MEILFKNSLSTKKCITCSDACKSSITCSDAYKLSITCSDSYKLSITYSDVSSNLRKYNVYKNITFTTSSIYM